MKKEAYLKLPKVAKDKAAKPAVNKSVSSSEATEDQEKVYNELIRFVEEKDSMYVVNGFAGTGKTTVMSWFVRWYVDFMEKKIAITAPTKKAVEIQQRFAGFVDKSVCYYTVHALLGLVAKIDNKGKQYFTVDKDKPAEIDKFPLVIMDEASQLSDEIFEHLNNYTRRGGKVIFVGDEFQIPPVNSDSSIPLSEEGRRKYSIVQGKMTEVVRQDKDGAIAELALEILKDMTVDVVPETKFKAAKGVVATDSAYPIIREYFLSENFKQDRDFVKIICHSTAAMDMYNHYVREQIYGTNRRLEIGEELIAKSFVYEGKKIIFMPTDTCKVESFTEERLKLGGDDLSLLYYRVQVTHKDVYNIERKQEIWVVHETEMWLYREILNHLTKNIDKAKGDGISKAWEEYYNFKQKFADMGYSYCISVYEAQGSTYDNAIVLFEDIKQNVTGVRRARMLYTACTRPRNVLFIVDDKK